MTLQEKIKKALMDLMCDIDDDVKLWKADDDRIDEATEAIITAIREKVKEKIKDPPKLSEIDEFCKAIETSSYNEGLEEVLKLLGE